MSGKVIGAGFLGIFAGVFFWTAWLSGQNRDSKSFWVLLAIGMLFFVPLVFLIWDIISPRSKAEKDLNMRFVPHWFMMGAAIVFGLCVISWIFAAIKTLFKM
jgi:hypothetical protein